MNIAILGAPGCVGRNLIIKLLDSPEYSITASYRIPEEIPNTLRNDRITWKQVNLLDASSAEDFLRDTDLLIYLIHSLETKKFALTDEQLAHDAGKAAQRAGVKKILFLGGIVPEGKNVSPHLKSRMQTGKALASYGIPVGEVRASILLGTCSVSYLIVYLLAKRLPIMIAPKSLNSLCAPISLHDAIDFLKALIDRPVIGHEIFEIGSDIVRYRDLLELSGQSIRGFKNVIIPFPLLPIWLSAPWIHLITRMPDTVGRALAEGLRNNTIPAKNRFKEITGRNPLPVDSVLKELAEEMRKKP
jgi:uncharacterized protein YbjT (DUF2867 family)